MSATLSIIDNFSLDAGLGAVKTIKQGAASDPASTAFEVTTNLTGANMFKEGSLATATALKVYDSAVDYPTTFDFMKYVADEDSYIQIISAATNFIVKVLADVPFSLSGFGKLLAAANTTPITGTEPTVAAVATIYIGNYSGNTMNYQIGVID